MTTDPLPVHRVGRAVPSIARLSTASLFALPGTGSLAVAATTGGPSGALWLHGAASILVAAILAAWVGDANRRRLVVVGLGAMGNLPLQAYAFHLLDVPVPGVQLGLWMVAGFIWTGQWLGPTACMWFTFPSAAAYTATLAISPGSTRSDWASAALVWPVAFGVGMTSAVLHEHLRRQRRRARRRGELLEVVVAATRDLVADDPVSTLRAYAQSVLDLGFHEVDIRVADNAGGSLECNLGEAIHLPADLTVATDARLLRVADRLVAVVPIPGSGQSGGRLVARTSDRDPADDDYTLEALQLLASQLGQAVELARRVQRDRLSLAALSEASRRDPLTALGNRRVADELIESLRTDDVLAIADLDHFKAVNDRFGHAVGDEVLVQFAKHLRTSLRPTDSAARWGGEEFIMVLRSAGLSSEDVLDRLLRDWIDVAPLATFSTGFAIHGEGHRGQGTFEAADRALFEAKHQGRARVCGSDPRAPTEALPVPVA